MNITVNDRHFGIQQFSLPLAERIKLKLNGEVYVFHARKLGWTGDLPFYIVKCGKCKTLFLDYPHGYGEYFLCPKCWDEKK